RKVRELMRRENYDVVHVMEPSVPCLPWYAAWFAGEAARIATFHAFSEQESAMSRWARQYLCRPHLDRFDAAIAVSHAARTYARRSWMRTLPIIPNGVDTSRFTPAATESRDDVVRFLFVGRWRDARKGLATLAAAFSTLASIRKNVELHVVGDGERRP